jgi:hypothetical protein
MINLSCSLSLIVHIDALFIIIERVIFMNNPGNIAYRDKHSGLHRNKVTPIFRGWLMKAALVNATETPLAADTRERICH